MAAAHAKTLPPAVQAAIDRDAPVAPIFMIDEVRAKLAVGPAMLHPDIKSFLVDRGVAEGLVPPALAEDLDAGWEALLGSVIPKWTAEQFKELPAELAALHAPSTELAKPAPAPVAKAAPAPANPKDPAGLAPPGVDPDRDPIAGRGTVSTAYDLEFLQKSNMLRDVLTHLMDNGVETQSDLIATCVALKDDVPVLSRVAGLESRIPRTLVTLGIELPA